MWVFILVGEKGENIGKKILEIYSTPTISQDCLKEFHDLNSLNPHKNSMRQILLSSSSYRRRNSATEWVICPQIP